MAADGRATGTRAARQHRAFALAAGLFAIAIAVVLVEIVARRVDGYRVWSVRLVRLPSPIGVDDPFREKWVDPRQAAEYVDRMSPASGVDRSWFWLSPPPFAPTPVDRDLAAQMADNPAAQLPSVYIWNRTYLRDTICGDRRREDDVFSKLRDAFVFDAAGDSRYPTYRFARNAHYPTGLHTNAFGWRGHDLALRKPAGTIRIAFVGSSTTVASHGEPFSYPELVERWLREWAATRLVNVRFEAINAAREGIDSHSIAAIVEQEVMPVDPDLIVYYEGSNQFWPDGFVREPVRSRAIDTLDPWRNGLDGYSAVGRRLHFVAAALKIEGREPAKPPLTVDWPADLSETDPDLSDRRLPVHLPEILGDVDDIGRAARRQGAELVMMSFNWLVRDGMVLNRMRDAMLYEYLNGTFGPFSYAHMRRYADFQNRVFAKFARTHGLEFIDFAAEYPRDPRLFYDAIHMTTAGIRLQAWIVFNRLVPILEARIADGRLPRRGGAIGADVHPAFVQPDRRTIPTDAVRAACGN